MNEAGLDLLKRFEGCTLEAKWDVDGWSIGYGLHGPDIIQGTVWTQDQCEEGLSDRLAETEKALDRMLMAPVTENQYAALVDFAYNCGLENLRKSTLLRYVNDGDIQQAAAEFGRWNHSAGKVLAGLTERRAAERDLFLLPDKPVMA